MKATIRCIVHPTEEIHRIELAIENILGPITLSTTKLDEFTEIYSSISSKDSFAMLRQLVHDKRILAAVRVRLLKNLDDFSTFMYFDKQAAYTGKLRLLDNTHEDPPLGFIEIRFEFESETQFEEFLDWFSPRTKDGRIIA
ncbi:MAG: RNA-binding domain-containing protein [Candidatus Thorarchaeota archaeon]